MKITQTEYENLKEAMDILIANNHFKHNMSYSENVEYESTKELINDMKNLRDSYRLSKNYYKMEGSFIDRHLNLCLWLSGILVSISLFGWIYGTIILDGNLVIVSVIFLFSLLKVFFIFKEKQDDRFRDERLRNKLLS